MTKGPTSGYHRTGGSGFYLWILLGRKHRAHTDVLASSCTLSPWF